MPFGPGKRCDHGRCSGQAWRCSLGHEDLNSQAQMTQNDWTLLVKAVDFYFDLIVLLWSVTGVQDCIELLYPLDSPFLRSCRTDPTSSTP